MEPIMINEDATITQCLLVVIKRQRKDDKYECFPGCLYQDLIGYPFNDENFRVCDLIEGECLYQGKRFNKHSHRHYSLTEITK
jgi:hypothetical protein